MTPPTRGSVMSPRPTSSSGHGRNWRTSRGMPASQRARASHQPTSTASGAGLRIDRVPGRQRRQHAARRDREREVPRRRDHHDAERLHAAIGELVGRLAERARVVAREVDRFRDFRVRLGHRLGAVEHHRADEIASLTRELGPAGLEPGSPLRDRPSSPRRQGRAGRGERAIDLGRAGERVAIGDAVRTRGIVPLALACARTRARRRPGAGSTSSGRSRQRSATSSIHARFGGSVQSVSGSFSKRPSDEGRTGRAFASTARSCGAARRVGERALDVERGEEPVPLGVPVRRAGLEIEHVAQEVLGRGVLVEPANQVRDGAVEVLGPHHRGVEEEPARPRLHRARLMVRHALQHLELDPRAGRRGASRRTRP